MICKIETREDHPDLEIDGREFIENFLVDTTITDTETGMEWDVKEEFLKLYDESHEQRQAILVYALHNAIQGVIRWYETEVDEDEVRQVDFEEKDQDDA